ncbi:MAG: hypothetical protein ACRCYE_03230 [Sarcina sp.]
MKSNKDRFCCRCKTKMTLDCKVDGLFMGKVRKFDDNDLINTAASYLNVAVCSGCGKVEMYVEDFTKFDQMSY